MYGISKYFWLNYRLQRLVVVAWIIISAALLSALFFTSDTFCQKIRPSQAPSLDFEGLGQGPFSLNPQYLNPQTPKILQALYVKIGSKIKFGEEYIHVGLQGLSFMQSLSLKQFTPLCFEDTSGDGSLEVLKSWSLKPVRFEGDLLILEARHQQNAPIMISLPVRASRLEEPFLNHPAVQALKKGMAMGIDLLCAEDQKRLSYRIYLDKKQIFLLKPQEEISYGEKGWEKGAQGYLRAQFLLDNEKPYFIVTDESGFEELKIPLEPMQEENFVAEPFIPQGVRVYQNQVMSCFIGRQKLILKPNDWVLKTGSFFQVLKSKGDIQSLLEFKKTGPLIVIEALEMKKQTCLVRGKIFSPLRMAVHPFVIEAPLVIPDKLTTKPKARGAKKA